MSGAAKRRRAWYRENRKLKFSDCPEKYQERIMATMEEWRVKIEGMTPDEREEFLKQNT